MREDLKESLMMITNKNISEYKLLKEMTTEDFLIKYRIFIEELEAKQSK